MIFGRKITWFPAKVLFVLIEIFSGLFFSALIALFISPFITFWQALSEPETWSLSFSWAVLMIIFGMWLAFIPLLIVALPIATLFVVKKWVGLPQILFAALISSFLSGYLVDEYLNISSGRSFVGVFLVLGIPTGFFFWLIECRPLRKKQENE